MADIERVTNLIEPVVTRHGFELVRLIMIGGTSDPTLQLMAEDPATGQLTLGQCETLSREISEILDGEEEAGRDPIPGGYRLEVSSPGIDRPLTRAKDYAQWAGHEARVKLDERIDGAKQLSGTLKGIEGDTVTIETPKGDKTFPLSAVASAKLLLTDKLINATAPLDSDGADVIKTER